MVEAWECPDCGNVNAGTSLHCLRCGHTRTDADPDMRLVAGLELSDHEWTTLLFAPLWVFSAVAGADGNVDDAELTAFGRVLEKSLYLRDSLLRELLGTIARDLRATFQAYDADERTIEEGLEEVGRMLDTKLLADHAIAYKRTLFALGDRVAKASGGGMLGIGARVSTAEKAVLLRVAERLGLTEDHLPLANEGHLEED